MNAFTVRLNFHGDLNFFLGSRTRSGRIERILSEKTSVKDVIESCGVPHPEVDLILVNGRAVAFDYGVEYTAEVDVNPVQAQRPYCEKDLLRRIPAMQRLRSNLLGRFAFLEASEASRSNSRAVLVG